MTTRPTRAQHAQQMGVLFIMTQQVQPAFIMAHMQSQQAWIMSQQALSPLVQVIVTPLSVISHLHIPIIILQQQTIIPFIIMQQEHMPPAIMVQRFCIMLADMASSLVQVIIIPPSHFSIIMVQRGTIIMFMPVGIPMPAGMPMPMPAGIPMPVVPIPVMPVIVPRSIILVVLAIGVSFALGVFGVGPSTHSGGPRFAGRRKTGQSPGLFVASRSPKGHQGQDPVPFSLAFTRRVIRPAGPQRHHYGRRNAHCKIVPPKKSNDTNLYYLSNHHVDSRHAAEDSNPGYVE
ncbi:hypothetical protein ACYOEI_11965 [Singulisphaera rosea]